MWIDLLQMIIVNCWLSIKAYILNVLQIKSCIALGLLQVKSFFWPFCLFLYDKFGNKSMDFIGQYLTDIIEKY